MSDYEAFFQAMYLLYNKWYCFQLQTLLTSFSGPPIMLSGGRFFGLHRPFLLTVSIQKSVKLHNGIKISEAAFIFLFCFGLLSQVFMIFAQKYLVCIHHNTVGDHKSSNGSISFSKYVNLAQISYCVSPFLYVLYL